MMYEVKELIIRILSARLQRVVMSRGGKLQQ